MGFFTALLSALAVRVLITAPVGRGELTNTVVRGLNAGDWGGVGGKDAYEPGRLET